MLFLARWARKLSWKETAEAFHTSWDQVCDAVEYVVGWGLEHRTLESSLWSVECSLYLVEIRVLLEAYSVDHHLRD